MRRILCLARCARSGSLPGCRGLRYPFLAMLFFRGTVASQHIVLGEGFLAFGMGFEKRRIGSKTTRSLKKGEKGMFRQQLTLNPVDGGLVPLRINGLDVFGCDVVVEAPLLLIAVVP